MKLIETVCYECVAGSVFNTFAEEVIMDVKRHERDSLMTFNGALIKVKQDSTVSDLWEEYQRQMKDAHDLVRFRNKESKPQFIEIFGRRVKIVEHSSEPADCMKCAFIGVCLNSSLNICQNAEMDFNRYFVEVDENGKEL